MSSTSWCGETGPIKATTTNPLTPPLQQNGQTDTDSASQVSIHSELQQQAIDILVEEKAELLKTKDRQNAAISQLQGKN